MQKLGMDCFCLFTKIFLVSQWYQYQKNLGFKKFVFGLLLL